MPRPSSANPVADSAESFGAALAELALTIKRQSVGTEDDSRALAVITEGAVRAIIRAAGDGVDGIFVGRCRFTGDITIPGEPVTIDVDASVLWGQSIPQTAERVREAITADLARHTVLNISAVNVTVHDVQTGSTEPEQS